MNSFLRDLSDEEALNSIFLLFKNIIEKKFSTEEEINGRLNSIGWKISEKSLIPDAIDVIELFFEKNLLHTAYTKIRDIIKTAKKEILIVDPYIDTTIFEIFKTLENHHIIIKILTMTIYGDFDHELALFKKEYSGFQLEYKKTKDFHDRFLIIDNSEVIHLGASIKDAGKKIFMINGIYENENKKGIIESFSTRWEQ